jgi:hypothetical protein
MFGLLQVLAHTEAENAAAAEQQQHNPQQAHVPCTAELYS